MAGAHPLSTSTVTYGRLYRYLSHRWWLTFLLMGMSFVCFGLLTLNLLHLVSANINFLVMNGLDAVRDGGLLQLLSLMTLGYLAAAFYVVFKLCEKVLVERLTYDNYKGP
ncbi:MAG: hypothetical protein CFE40_00845 [Burkholderiales bacterium PBB1]|nr:MAG: hypothetical protein CFE40_00845 [Burkholderiales bacterium PBB1]